MLSVFRNRIRSILTPPRLITLPLAGIDISTSGVKAVRLRETEHGPMLDAYAQARLPLGVWIEGEIIDRAVVAAAIAEVAAVAKISSATVSLPNTIKRGGSHEGDQRTVDEVLKVFDKAGVAVNALEEEAVAMTRALLSQGEAATVLGIDIGKMTTKLMIVSEGVPRFSATIGTGGHPLTLAVQKHFGVTEEEARRVKAKKGITPMPGSEAYREAMLSTISALRDDIVRHLAKWREKTVPNGEYQPVARAILVGGNASVRGLPEYFERALGIPVFTGDVFTNFASHDTWIPTLPYTESLAYATPVGLALRNHYSYGRDRK